MVAFLSIFYMGQEAGKADNSIQRCTYFVTHVGKKGRFQAV